MNEQNLTPDEAAELDRALGPEEPPRFRFGNGTSGPRGFGNAKLRRAEPASPAASDEVVS